MLHKFRTPDIWLPYILLAVLYVTAVMLRPLFPIDETRYMTVAWEMYLRGDWLAPLTVNFQPYHHKPPLLFWLINMSWSVFGVSRWAGMLPALVASFFCLFLTRKLAEMLFPENQKISRNVPMLMIGSVPFLIYGLLIMFDITLTVFVLLSLLALLSFAKSGEKKYLLWFAIAIGMGVLTKGPVAWLYVIFPILLAPLWLPQAMKPLKWYGGCLIALLLSTIPVLLWLIPVLSQSSDKFAYWLVWEQTAGRVTGNFSASHARPVWFYLPLLPVMFLPWVFFPSFWKGMHRFKQSYSSQWAVRFLLIWMLPVFIAFSLISGKQPHYLVPLLPGVLILIALWLEISFKKIYLIAGGMAAILVLVQVVGALTFFKRYDLQPVVAYMQAHQQHDWAYIPKYHGELTFLGRLEKAVDNEQMDTIDEWFATHPDGLAVIRFQNPAQVSDYEMVFDMPYRSKRIGIFKRLE